MNANELWRQLAGESVGDLPINNLVPLLQQLGRSGVTISHIAPFLSDQGAQERLTHFIFGGGFELTKDEIQAINILGSEYVLLAPTVLDTLGHADCVSRADRKICVPRELLEEAAKRNRECKISHDDGWRLVYCAPLSLAELLTVQFRDNVTFRMQRYGRSVKMEESRQFPASSKWAHEKPEDGYLLVNYHPHNCKNGAGEEVWREQEESINRLGAKRMGAVRYAQSVIVHFALKHCFPWSPHSDSQPVHWAVNEPTLRTYIKASESKEWRDYGSVDLNAGEGAKIGFTNGLVHGVYYFK